MSIGAEIRSSAFEVSANRYYACDRWFYWPVETSTRPANGTYGFPYIILRDKFTVGITILVIDGNTYNGDASANTASGRTLADYDDNLRNLGGKMLLWFIGATIPIGTIDAFLTYSSLVRSESIVGTHYNSGTGACVKVAKLVWIINLTTPFTIDQSTTKMQFNFVVSN